MAQDVEVAIVGAGPYGLSLASYLTCRGIGLRIFGFPMRAWRQMPPGMCLKSFGFATSIPTPEPGCTLPEYCRARGLEDFEPIKFDTFSEYGEWFQERFVPNVERAHVTRVIPLGRGGFEVSLETSERFAARSVVVAVGLGYFIRIPELFSSVPADRVTHTAHTGEFLKNTPLAGRDVTVVGAGQSALEAAALLHEGGAHVRLLARGSVWWNTRMGQRSLLERVRNPNTVVGPGRRNWVLQHVPMLPYYLPVERRVRLTRTYLGPLGAWWLRDRVQGKVEILQQTSIARASMDDGRVLLTLRTDTGAAREILTDHVIAGTGYEPDVDRLPFLQDGLAARIRRVERAPALSSAFESSVPGLYFVGPASAFAFGPLVRFVAGAAFVMPRLTRHLARRLRVSRG